MSLIGLSDLAAAERVRLICVKREHECRLRGTFEREEPHLVDLWAKLSPLDVQVDLDNLDVVDLGADAVHAVRGRAHECAVASRDARDAEQEVDDLVAADAEEEVVGRGDAPQFAQALLDVVVGRGRVAVQVEVVERGCARGVEREGEQGGTGEAREGTQGDSLSVTDESPLAAGSACPSAFSFASRRMPWS